MFKKFALMMATALAFAACSGGGLGSGPTAGSGGSTGGNTAGGPPTTPVNIVLSSNPAGATRGGPARTIFASTQGYSLTISQNYIVGSSGECSVATQTCLPPITYFGTINQSTGQASVQVNLVIGAKPLIEARAFDQSFSTSYTASSGQLSTSFPFFAVPAGGAWGSSTAGNELSYGASNGTMVVVGLASIPVAMGSSVRTAALNAVATPATNAGGTVYGAPAAPASGVPPTSNPVSGLTVNSPSSKTISVGWNASAPYTPPGTNSTTYNVYYGIPGSGLVVNMTGATVVAGQITVIPTIVSAGTGYHVGDTFYILESGSSKDAVGTVTVVNAAGGVTTFTIVSPAGTGGYSISATVPGAATTPTSPTPAALTAVQGRMNTSPGQGLVLDLTNVAFTIAGNQITATTGALNTNTAANCAADTLAPSAVIGVVSGGSGYKVGDNIKVLETGSTKDAVLQVNSVCTNTISGIMTTGIVNGIVFGVANPTPQGTGGYSAVTAGAATTPTQTLFNGVIALTSLSTTLTNSGSGISSSTPGANVLTDGNATYQFADGTPAFFAVAAQTVDPSGNAAALVGAATAKLQVSPGSVTGAPASITVANGTTTGTASSANTATLSWAAVAGASSYSVYYDTNPSNVIPTASGSGLTLNVTASGGVVTGVSIGSNAGQGYSAFDSVYIQAGNNNATAKVNAVINGVPISVSLVVAGTGYNAASYSNAATSAFNTQNFIKGLPGTVTATTLADSGSTVTSSAGGTVGSSAIALSGTTGTPYYFVVSATGTPVATYGGNLAAVKNPALGLTASNGNSPAAALPLLTSTDESGGLEWSIWQGGVEQYVSGCNPFPAQGLQPTCYFALQASPAPATNAYGSVSTSGVYTPPLAYPGSPGAGPIPISLVSRNKVVSLGTGATITTTANPLSATNDAVANPGTGYHVGDVLNVANCNGGQLMVTGTAGVGGGVATVSVWDPGSAACTAATQATTVAQPSTAGANAATFTPLAGAGITAAVSPPTSGGLGYRVGDVLEICETTLGCLPASDGTVQVATITPATGAILTVSVVSAGTTVYTAAAGYSAPASSPVPPANPVQITTAAATGLSGTGAAPYFGLAGSGYSVGDILEVCAVAVCTPGTDGTIQVTSVNPITGALTGFSVVTAGTTVYAAVNTNTVAPISGGGDPLSVASDGSSGFSDGVSRFNLDEFLAGNIFGQ
ncbi:MAG: hypothetical protein HY098_04870 [Nitrospinae bacterium]|nr:hypothetical protein [Nitrospinota bacterium]